MGITISHESALQVVRKIRCGGDAVSEMDRVDLRAPSTWVGKRWTHKEFKSEAWLPEPPSCDRPLHALAPARAGSVRMAGVVSHLCRKELPPNSIVYLTPNFSCVCPELLFFQLATSLALPKAVMVGYELCGNFSILPDGIQGEEARTQIPAATCVDDIRRYLNHMESARGIVRARQVLNYVCDSAISVPEAVISTMYSLPSSESGYELGPLALNKRVLVESDYEGEQAKSRFPDILLPFAPVGVNYDGEHDHLDLNGLVDAARAAEHMSGAGDVEASAALAQKVESVRMKYVDDIMRNCQFAARGYVVLPATKENLYGSYNLDVFTRRVLLCAKSIFGANVDKSLKLIDDTDARRDRYEVLNSLLFPKK